MPPQLASDEATRELGLIHKISLCDTPNAPIVYLIHGRAGNVDVMWLFRRCLPDNVHIISLQAPMDDEIGGYSWWSIAAEKSLAYQQAIENAQLAARFIDQAPHYYQLSPEKSLAFGFSQGSGLITLLIQLQLASFDAIAILAGFVMKLQNDPPEKVIWPDIFWGHGLLDETITIERARTDRDFLLDQGATVQFEEESVGHKIGAATMRSLKEWVNSML